MIRFLKSDIISKSSRLNFGSVLIAKRAFKSKVMTLDEALSDIPSNVTILSGGFGISGLPETLINGILARPSQINNITAVSNNSGGKGKGLNVLIGSGQISRMVASYLGGNKIFESSYLNGKIELELTPQGTIAEKVRAGSAGVPAFYTATGVGTMVEEGTLPLLYEKDSNGTKILKTSKPRETRDFNGKKYLLEEAINGDLAIIRAEIVDEVGNCWFKGSARNFNNIFGRNAKITIVEADNIVPVGTIKPEDVHLPGIFVDRIITAEYPKDIENLTLSKPISETSNLKGEKEIELTLQQLKRQKIIKRSAQEFEDGQYVNLGIGMPTIAANYLPSNIHVTLQSENGILGTGPYPEPGKEDPDVVNAGKETVTLLPGASLFGNEESFAMIRAGKIDLTILGALQVSQNGDLANWGLPGKIKGMGGAMDLVSNPDKTRVVVVMEHTDKNGNPKLVKECTFPFTGTQCVERIITELGVWDVVKGKGLVMVEIAKDTTLEDVKKVTEADFEVSKNLKTINI